MPTTANVTAGLYAWALSFADGSARTVPASSVDSAVSGIWPSPVVGVTRGAAIDPAAPSPVLTTLVPNTAALGDPSFTLHVNGTGFQAGDVILWNGSPEPTTLVSPTELTTAVNMLTAQTAMPIPVAVRSIVGADSNILTFTLAPAP